MSSGDFHPACPAFPLHHPNFPGICTLSGKIAECRGSKLFLFLFFETAGIPYRSQAHFPLGEGEAATWKGGGHWQAHAGSLFRAEEGAGLGIADVGGPLLGVQESAGLTAFCLLGPISGLCLDCLYTNLLLGAQIPWLLPQGYFDLFLCGADTPTESTLMRLRLAPEHSH